jgi:hypothetical protein
MEDLFFLRGDLLRPKFGLWDPCDEVAHAILDIVEAQHGLTDAIANFAEYNNDNNEAEIKAAIKEREAAGKKLMKALSRVGHDSTQDSR